MNKKAINAFKLSLLRKIITIAKQGKLANEWLFMLLWKNQTRTSEYSLKNNEIKMITSFDRLALSIGKVYLLLASLVLFALVLLYRRYGRYLRNLDRVETCICGADHDGQCQ
jgi:hypothetical protein